MENDPEQQDPTTKAEPKPALVINIHTWATPIIGLVMLLVGLAGGYFGRPFITRSEKTTTVVTSTADPDTQTNLPAATTSPEDQANREEMMDFIVSQTRHFIGDPEAKITIVEFSDFQ